VALAAGVGASDPGGAVVPPVHAAAMSEAHVTIVRKEGRHLGIVRMVERYADEEPPLELSLDAPIAEIDPKLAARRSGFRTKGPEAAEVLAKAFDITTVGGLLHHYPRRYIDRSHVATLRRLPVGAYVTVIARVTKVFSGYTRHKKSMVKVTISDGSGKLELTFFNQPWTAAMYREGQELAVSGMVTLYKGRPQLTNQQVEMLSGDDQDLVHTARITPVHPASEGITTKTIRELIHRALERLPSIPDPLPTEIVGAEHLGSYDRAMRDIHFPEDDSALNAAVERLKFDELFTLELGVAFRKHRAQADQRGVAHRADGELTDRLMATIPFEATKAQERAVQEIGTAMARPTPMNVLLQGDVGAGKTLVALHACLVAIGSAHQAAIMAPTEVLAGQHYRSIEALLPGVGAVPYLDLVASRARATGRKDATQASLLDPDPAEDDIVSEASITYALLTGAVTGKDRVRILEGIAEGNVDLVVGTQALVQESVSFADLSLAVVDEQHRFGLHQRMALKGKGGEPDVLIMTATPIPRTLALTYYGDLDVVVLDEMPKGRQPIETRAVRTELERAAAYDLVREEVQAGRQGFVVCAAIDEGNRTQVKAAEAEAERLATQIFPDLRVDLLHGRMRPKDKEAVMDRFRERESDLLISTTVIEVGVDVPNATVMLVEDAERFGLAQLHQLRGRIGRGAHASYCVLFDGSEEENKEARARVAAMVRTTDGFELADEDLRLRGEGTLFDTKQSGMPDLKLARLAEDMELVKRSRARAFALIEDDPGLEAHPRLLDQLRQRFERSIDWLFAS
jgi:ATP-dependent DNA helicase RecG